MKTRREAFAREYITQALMLLLKDREYRDISITEICQKAGVARVSFYRNFESKDDILIKEVEAVTDEFLERSKISYKNDSTVRYFEKLFIHMESNRQLCTALRRAGLIHVVKDEFDRVFLNNYKLEYDRYKSVFISGGIYNVFYFWFINGCREKPHDLATRLEDILSK